MFVRVFACLTIAVAACASAAVAEGPEGSAIPGATPPADVVQQITERQTELAILELAIKKAELKKRLQELQVPAEPGVPHTDASASDAPATAQPPRALQNPPSDHYAVHRIHRIRGHLVAAIALPDGAIKELAKGAVLPGGLLIADIRSDGVSVRRGQGEPYDLPPAAVPWPQEH